MAIASLRYDTAAEVNESRNGVFIYDGGAAKYHEWSFRTSMRMSSQKEEDMPKTMSMIIDALRGDAAQIAMDIGTEELLKKVASPSWTRGLRTLYSLRPMLRRRSYTEWDTSLEDRLPDKSENRCTTSSPGEEGGGDC